jgi:hypothetical protein
MSPGRCVIALHARLRGWLPGPLHLLRPRQAVSKSPPPDQPGKTPLGQTVFNIPKIKQISRPPPLHPMKWGEVQGLPRQRPAGQEQGANLGRPPCPAPAGLHSSARCFNETLLEKIDHRSPPPHYSFPNDWLYHHRSHCYTMTFCCLLYLEVVLSTHL